MDGIELAPSRATLRFMEAKCRVRACNETEAGVTRLGELARGEGGGRFVLGPRASDLERALVRESHWLSAAPPRANASVVWNAAAVRVRVQASLEASSGCPMVRASCGCAMRTA